MAGNSPVYGPGWEFPLVVAQGVAGKPGLFLPGRTVYFCPFQPGVPSSPWSSSTSTSMCCWWAQPASARASWSRPWAMPASGRATPPFHPCRRVLSGHVPGQGGRPHLPVGPNPGPAHPGRPGPAPPHPLAVGGPVRADPDRHRASSFVITSNRAVDEWLSLFDDPILCNSALDRLANASYQIVIEGSSYRERLTPHRGLLDPAWKGGD